MKKWIISTAALCAVSLCITGCGSQSSSSTGNNAPLSERSEVAGADTETNTASNTSLVGSWRYDEAASKNCENMRYSTDTITTFDADGMLYFINTETYSWEAENGTLLIYGEHHKGDQEYLEAECPYSISGDTLTITISGDQLMTVVFHRMEQ